MEKKTILIVDEEEKNIKLMKAMLKSENYHLFSALSGTDCMKMVMDISPDLILLDILISNMDGFEICRRLKQEEKTRKIPIVMASMLTEKKHRIKGIKAGADDFLSKPVDKTELLVRVKSLLRMKSYHDALSESEAKYRTVYTLAGGIAHDFNNLLMGIQGRASLIKMDIDSSHPYFKHIRRIEELVESAADLTKQLLGFAKGKLDG